LTGIVVADRLQGDGDVGLWVDDTESGTPGQDVEQGIPANRSAPALRQRGTPVFGLALAVPPDQAFQVAGCADESSGDLVLGATLRQRGCQQAHDHAQARTFLVPIGRLGQRVGRGILRQGDHAQDLTALAE
jgi:hypothetical protein